MKKIYCVLISLLGLSLHTQAQLLKVAASAQVAENSREAHESTANTSYSQRASTIVNDTMEYFFAKHYYRNSTSGSANTSFFTLKSPYQTALNIGHCGAVFLNNTSITVNGLEGLVLKNPTSPSSAVPFRLYLCNVNSNNLPIFPAIDSVQTSVSNPTAGVWRGASFTTPVNITGNFAVLFKCVSTVPGDTLRMFLNNANTPTSTAAPAIRYGEGLGVMRFSSFFQSTTNTFGTGTDYEFVVAPYVSYNLVAGATVLTPSVCPLTQGSFSNVTTPMSLVDSRFFNLNKFKPYWAPTNSAMPAVTDSIYTWIFSGSGTPPTNVKSPSAIFNTLGNQTASLTVRVKSLKSLPPVYHNKFDVSIATVIVANGTAPPMTVSGSTAFCSNGFITTTLTANGATSYTWNNPISVTPSIVVTASSPVVYTVISENLGCYAIKIVTVMVSPIPNVFLAASSSTMCNLVTGGSTIALTGTPPGGVYSGTNVQPGKFTPSSIGSFSAAYTFTDGLTGCTNSVTTKITVFSCLGLTENNGLENVSVFPNPAKGGKFKVHGLSAGGKIAIYDVLGRQILETLYENDTCEIDLNTYNEGNYFLQVNSVSGAKITLRIVNQH